MNELNFLYAFAAAIAIGAAGGLLGSFALLRRMALVGDALSHVALPGIALAFLLNLNVFAAALAFLLMGTVGIWAIEHKTKLPVETLVGVFFALALAIGTLLTPSEHLLEALFGDITAIGAFDLAAVTVLSLGIVAALLFLSRKLILAMISSELARAARIRPHAIELLFLLLFALTVAVGIKFVGALLMGALVIIPAATARNLSRAMNQYMIFSAGLGSLGSALGVLSSFLFGFPPGPSVVLFMGLLFFFSIVLKK